MYKDVKLEKSYDVLMEKNRKKSYGCFYTPNYIIDYIIKNTFDNLDVIKTPFVKILDPSCGSGYFLIKVIKFLVEDFTKNIDALSKKYEEEEYIINGDCKLKGKDYWKVENIILHIVNHCVYGADIDYNAVEICKQNIVSTCENRKGLILNVVCCDSLIKWEKAYINKTEKSNYLCDFWSKKYDYIVGNPPWVSLNRKNKQCKDIELINYYINEYEGNIYLPNLYEYFLKRSLQVLKMHGRIGFVLPDRLAKNLQYKNFRKKIILNYSIKNLAFEITFPNINTDVMIFVLERSYSKDNEIDLYVHKKRNYRVYQSQYLKNENYEFLYNSNSFNLDIKKRIEMNSKFLGDICTTFTGFIGNSKEIKKYRVNSKQISILKGENITNFKILSKFYYEFEKQNIKGGTSNIKKLTYSPKIVLRKTGNTIIAALDEDGTAIEQSLYGIINLDKRFSYKYVLGILNSKLMQWYYSSFLITNSKSIPQLKKYSLNQIPIKFCDAKRQYKIENLVDKISKQYNLYEKFKDELDNEVFDLYEVSDKYRDKLL
ncbi:TaqI-like C-terminal specificity domain-containing protein [Clostridium sp. JS66]|uniref:TaqI-like C-terminal specificity domain-containing protein n=1 Tax=Clostridium sp. JS66 TaxID=3064705 RepID=UPI00298D6C8C|nr:TaqI-like C-terminal specificity domain-containing protein [Clostridium sp. JS66]WPC42570.1 TaqI-like C-terminal specificity domain-containing protein [Clostridium sp. JS66]